MALHAIDEVTDAATISKAFLTPIEWRQWVKLALIVFFAGGGVSLTSGQSGTSTSIDLPLRELSPLAPGADLLVAGLVVVAFLGVGVFLLVGSIMNFVLIETLRTGTVSIRAYWRTYWRAGLRLFGFRVAIGVPLLLLLVGWLGATILPTQLGITLIAPIWIFIGGFPVILLAGLLYGIVNSFTTMFVVPIMIQRDLGVLAAWRVLWGSIKTAWKQYLAYAVVASLLTVVAGLVVSIVLTIVGVILLLPIAIIAGGLFLTGPGMTPFGIAGILLIGLVVGLVMLVVWGVVQVPVVTYLRYYALLVLGDIEPELDLVADRRPTAAAP